MVGRPPPKYEGYKPIPSYEEEEKEKKTKKKHVDIDQRIAELEKEREYAEKLSKARGIKKETFKLKHPNIVEGKQAASRAGSRLTRFAGGILMTGTRGIRSRRRPSVRPTHTYSSRGRTSLSDDISLTRAIAINSWSGEGSGIMERDFFGHDNQDRELIRDRNPDVNIGGSFQRDFFGDKSNQDLIGDRDKKVNIGSNFNNDFF